ncbi:MAG: putative signal transducing protein [Bacteroidota bacterium]
MKDNQSDMVRVYSDTEININKLRAELAKIGIPSLVKNEFQSGVMAGFGASPNAVDLYVNTSDVDEATALIQDLNKE